MKKILFLFALLCGATSMAQKKAVAVTEVVDKEDKVSYATEIMVRTRLTAAISMKQGYTAYDRVDLQSIMSEQNFQRTGLVDDATIKRLGEMTGASLILIPEVAMSDEGKIYVAVKMLDVTTAQTLMSTGELMGSSSDEVEEGCRSLTAKILGVRSGTSSTTAVSDKPVTLFGYIHVFPTDVGEFQTLPAQLLSAINKKATYGYDSWRLPTTEELSIMRANSHLIPNFKNTDYLCSDSSVKGLARLVTTEMSVAEKKEARERDEMIRKQAIYNLLEISPDDHKSWIMIEDKRIVFRVCSPAYVFDTNGNIVQYSSAKVPTKEQLSIFINHIPKEHRDNFFCVNDPNVHSYCYPMDKYGNQLANATQYNSSAQNVYIRYSYKRTDETSIIQFYNYPDEDTIRQEMQKYY